MLTNGKVHYKRSFFFCFLLPHLIKKRIHLFARMSLGLI
jgi:hypothetical protein